MTNPDSPGDTHDSFTRAHDRGHADDRRARMRDPESAAMDALMERLGYVMLHWSLLERAVLQEIKRLRSADGDTGESSIRGRGAFSERLAEWQALVSLKGRRNAKIANEVGEIASKAERLRRTRNLLAQHFDPDQFLIRVEQIPC